jgi:hypothetical protein
VKTVKLADYWLVNICNRLDTYHPLAIGRTERGFYSPHKLGIEGREVFSLDRIGRCHAWHDKFASGRCISDTFACLLPDAGLTGGVPQALRSSLICPVTPGRARPRVPTGNPPRSPSPPRRTARRSEE